MKLSTRVKFIYRMAAFCWLLWAGSLLLVLAGDARAKDFSVMAAMAVGLIGVHVMLEGTAGVDAVTSGSAAMSVRVARFIYGAAAVVFALGAVAVLIWLADFKQSSQALQFIHTAPNAVVGTAGLCALVKNAQKPKDRPLLDAPRFLAGLALLGVCLICFAILVATRDRVEAARGVRSAASWTALAATVGYLAVMFRKKAFHLAKERHVVMDDGDHPPLWMRVFLIYTAQGCAVVTLCNVLLMLVTGLMAKDFAQSVQISFLIGMVIGAAISAGMVIAKTLRGNLLPGHCAPPPKPAAPKPVVPRPVAPKPATPKPPATVSAAARRQQLYARAKALEKEEDDALKGIVPVSEKVPPSTERPAAQTPAELSQRRALEADLVTVLSAYCRKREKALQEYRARHNALKAQAQADAARLKASAALREKKPDEAVASALIGESRAKQQKQARAERATALAREAAATPAPAIVAPLDECLERVAARLEPRGAALSTAQGQRALLADLAALLPGFDAARADALVRTAGQSGGPALPEVVGQALEMACDALARTRPEEALACWRQLSPEALVRGWRALRLYGGISTARAMFEAVASRLAAHMQTRPDCVQWLEARAGRGEAAR